jgi:hypothetical protein
MSQSYITAQAFVSYVEKEAESGEDGEDACAMAAANCLLTITTLLSCVWMSPTL